MQAMPKTVTDELIMLPSVTKLKGQDQIDEIERRLSLLYEDCRQRDAAVTKVHIRTVLGIDENTFYRWLKAELCTRMPGGGKKDISIDEAIRLGRFQEEDRRMIMERRACLKKWLDRAETSCMEAISANPKAGGPMFQAKAIFGYREKEESGINMQISLDDFLKGIRRPDKMPDKRNDE